LAHNSGELERIYQAVSNDLDKWDGQEPLEDYLTKILEKRLLLNEVEARTTVKQILLGIYKYKKTKEFVNNNPEVLKEISKLSKENEAFKSVVDKALGFFKSLKENVSDGK